MIICRRCRFYNSTSRKRIGETYKAFLNLNLEKKKKKKKTETSEEGTPDVEKIEEKEEKIETTEKNVRLFHDDTFKGFFRRLSWSNDGKLRFKTKTQEMSGVGLATTFEKLFTFTRNFELCSTLGSCINNLNSNDMYWPS